MPRFTLPRVPLGPRWLATVALAVAVAACGGAAAAASPGPSAAARPSLRLEVAGGPAAGSYASDPSATLNLCTHQADGSWRGLYAGGDPWISVDLFVGAQIGEPGHESDAALEIEAGSGYLWIDQGGFRGGDKKGRSSITVDVQRATGTTTLVVAATTPNRTPSGDGLESDVALTWTCPG